MLNLNYVKPDWIMLSRTEWCKPELREAWLNDVKPDWMMLNLNYVKPDWIMLSRTEWCKPELREAWLNYVKPECDSRTFFFREKRVGCVLRRSQ
jgi:hypothetical protein